MKPFQRTIHRLKTWPEPFQAVKYELKLFEIRKDDRGYKTDDVLVLDEWDPKTKRYTDEDPITRIVTYVLDGGFGLAPGHVAMSLDRFASRDAERVVLEVAPPRPLTGVE